MLLLLWTITPCHAQIPAIEKSAPVDVTFTSWNRLLQLKNGNTHYFSAGMRGMEVNVYDATRKIVAKQVIKSKYLKHRKMKRVFVAGLYEIGGQPVLFYWQAEKSKPVMYRMRFDAGNGSLVQEERIGDMPEIKLMRRDGSDIYVEKDPATDNYAIIFFNGNTTKITQRVRVIHYNGSHNVINAAYCTLPEDHDHQRYIGAVVDGDKRVFLASFAFNRDAKESSPVYISRLGVGDAAFFTKRLALGQEMGRTASVMHYDRQTNAIRLLSAKLSSAKYPFGTPTFYYRAFLCYIDAEHLGLKSEKPILNKKVNAYAMTTLGAEQGFAGVPQQMIMNADMSITLLSEEITQTIVRTRSTYNEYSVLGTMVISELDAEGNETDGYMIRKKQECDGLVESMYMADRTRGKWYMKQGGDEHSSFAYIRTEKGKYIIFNDNRKNFDREEDDAKRKMARGLHQFEAACYKIDEGGVKRSYLFGDPEKTDARHVVMITSAHQHPTTGVYATLLREYTDKGEAVRVAWLRFP
ncbi:hypothetical protein GCM10023093_21210 [Nemorincola caseinilytica]|uniref:Uncharacterized protein n=1 Tax=Nemorincola caseinilytica TaxID=2054315 RepID=A0ABP8NK24_9BACT